MDGRVRNNDVAKIKRRYSKAFTPRTGRNVHLNIARCPPGLLTDFRKKCRRVNISQRALVLGWIRNWNAGRRPDDDDPVPCANSQVADDTAISPAEARP
jgi:hypothetical protein